MPRSRRAAIVGLGIKAPGGCTPSVFWDSCVTGDSAATLMPELAGDHPTEAAPFGCPVSDDDSTDTRYFRKPELRRIDPVARLGVAAAQDAMDGLADVVPPERRGASIGTGVGGLRTYGEQSALLTNAGYGRCSPFTVPMMMPNSLAAWLSLRHELRGPSHTVAAACASATAAIGEAAALIGSGRADLVIAGGSEAVLYREVFLSFARMEALAKDSGGGPKAASRPFDVARNGFVLGEGAAMMTLVADEIAQEQGLPVLGWVDGYGATSDAHHMVAPPDDGEGAARAMHAALTGAGMAPDEVSHVNAHGTSTPRNDVAESIALETVFGPDGPPITSTKGVTGHLLGATGAVELLASLVGGALGAVPPVANTVDVDPEITVDVVTNEVRSVRPGPVLSNSFAFGGHNASVVVTPAPNAAALLDDRWNIRL